MTKPKNPTRQPPTGALARESQHDRRTEMVRDMIAKESAVQDAKTNRLRALRLAKEAEDKAAADAAPKPVKPKPAPKPRRITAG
jgi:hypothetical protein